MHVGSFVCEYFRQHPGVVVAYTFTLLSFPVGIVVLPALLAKIMDHMKSGTQFARWRWLLLAIVMGFLLLLATYLVGINVDVYVNTDVQSHARTRVYRAIMESNSYRYRALPVSNVISKTLKLPQSIFEVIAFWRDRALPAAVTMAALVGYFFYVDWRLGTMLLSIAISIGLLLWLSAFVCVEGMIGADYHHDRIHQDMGDVMDNLMHIYLSGGVAEEMDRLRGEQARLLDNMRTALQCANHFTGIMQVTLGLAAAGVIVYAWRRYQNGHFSVEKMIGLLFVLMTSRHVIYSVLGGWPENLYNMSLLEKMGRYMTILDMRARLGHAGRRALSADALRACRAGGQLVFDDVSFAYPAAPDGPAPPPALLRNVSLALEPGMAVRVTGPIGSGKSTLALLALGLHVPTSGRISICGHDTQQLTRADLSRLVGYVPQNPRLLNRTLEANMVLGTTLTRADVERGLQTLHVRFAGPDTPAGKDGSRFSSGQRVTLYLMRAMLRDTPILICDEVTANLDPASQARVLDTLRTVAQGRVLLFITHDPQLAFPFTHALTMGHGQARLTPM